MIGVSTRAPAHPALAGALPALNFALPPALEASLPPEKRGLRRDQVRLMVSYRQDGRLLHTRFDHLPEILNPGDILVINTSGTLKAALQVRRADGTPMELHLSTRLPERRYVVELRFPIEQGADPFYGAESGERLLLPAGGEARLQSPYPKGSLRRRLWVASLELPLPLADYLERYGFPIRYKYIRQEFPIAYYQNVYSTTPGSAEMPSAGRAFTPELITQLVAHGVLFAPLILHTGVASQEEGERPYEEAYCLPAASARLINTARSAGGRVIAVGTTAVRALQTAADKLGRVHPADGWTSLVITPQTALTAIDGLLTGMHEPRSSHLSMLLALAGFAHIEKAYHAALQEGYLWHEFGDLHLILP